MKARPIPAQLLQTYTPTMLELSRTVRFCLSGQAEDFDSPRDNTFSAWPAMRGLGRYYELIVTCLGEADPQTGYFINIKEIDLAVRDHALTILSDAIREDAAAPDTPMGALMHRLLASVGPALNDTVTSLTLVLTPCLSFTAEKNKMHQVLLRQQFEFSAAHRLHVPDLSDEENLQTFGKCNNPAGHGHNYRIEVAARCPIDQQGQALDPATLDAAVNGLAIDKLDHKHLNNDVPEFAELNPSVENIVKVVWQMLDGKLPGEATLDEVKVWETGKTVCAYRGD